PTKHGFEEFYGTLTSAKTFWDREHFLRLPVGRKPKPYAENKFYGTDALADHALEFIELSSETPDKPWFLYLAFNAPHFPLHAPEEAISKYAKKYSQGWDTLRHERLIQMIELGVIPKDTQLSVRSPHYDWGESKSAPNPDWNSLPSDRRADLSRRMAIYAAMVDRMDENIGRLINYLEASGELDNTLLIFTSDNGACAEWDEHGFDLKSGTDNILHRGEELLSMGQKGTFHSVGSGWANVSNTPWRLYKHFNHEGGISVPCIIHWPARLVSRRGQIDRTPTHLIDIAPTLLDVSISGSPVVDEANPLPGRSLVELIQGGDSADRTLFFEHEGNRAVREGTWKLVALRNQDWELYDLRNDRIESNDLSINHPQVVRRLSEAWDQWALENRVTPLPNDYRVEYLPNH
ncbi:MAG: sulfatase-like hydrolase/transferase, partial [Planctomycetota bacterium]